MAGIDRVVTHGTFELDGGSWEVDNNIWLVGGDDDGVVIDAAQDAGPIFNAARGRNGGGGAGGQLGAGFDAPVLLHPADEMLWRMTQPGKEFRGLQDGEVLNVAGTELRAIHTPGHSPGSTCLHAPELGAVFSGDTLFQGGPGATGRSYSDFPTILASISERLGKLPGDTVVYTRHGDSTTTGGEPGDCDE